MINGKIDGKIGSNGTHYLDVLEARLRNAEVELERFEQELEHAEMRVRQHTELTDAVRKLLALEKEIRSLAVNGGKIDPDSLRNTSVRNALIEIAKPNGVLKTQEAVRTLCAADVFSSEAEARDNIYSTLAKSMDFSKISPGLYRLLQVGITQPQVTQNAQRPPRRLARSEQVELDVVAAIAHNQDGYIRHAQTKKALAESGLFKNESGVNFALRRVLKHSERFERIERGLYHLLPEQDVEAIDGRAGG